MHLKLVGQQLAQLDVETGQLAVLLEAPGWRSSIEGNAQLAPIVHVINQFGVSQRAHQWQ